LFDILEEITQLPKSVTATHLKLGEYLFVMILFGKDLEKLANLHQLSIEEVIEDPFIRKLYFAFLWILTRLHVFGWLGFQITYTKKRSS
jgi:hypothetical protein